MHLKIAVFVDASFASNSDLSSQLGFMVCMIEQEHSMIEQDYRAPEQQFRSTKQEKEKHKKVHKANILHYGSQKAKRVTRSVLAAELYAMTLGFDIAYTIKAAMDEIKAAMDEMMEKPLPLAVMTDSRSLYDAMVTLNSTTEKRLLIDLRVLRDSYEKREITEIMWIPSGDNPADALTKSTPNAAGAMRRLMDRNEVAIVPKGWVERKCECKG